MNKSDPKIELPGDAQNDGDQLDQTPLLSPQDVADHLQSSLRHVRREIASGALPVVRLGSRMLRITPKALARYIAERQS
jgi:excisionase family DNA binding protein